MFDIEQIIADNAHQWMSIPDASDRSLKLAIEIALSIEGIGSVRVEDAFELMFVSIKAGMDAVTNNMPHRLPGAKDA